MCPSSANARQGSTCHDGPGAATGIDNIGGQQVFPVKFDSLDAQQ
jgi:hypothetical protein